MSDEKIQNIQNVLWVPFAMKRIHILMQPVQSPVTGELQKSLFMSVYTLFLSIFYGLNVLLIIISSPRAFLDFFLKSGYVWVFVGFCTNVIIKFVFFIGVIVSFVNRENQILFYGKINAIDIILNRDFAERIDHKSFGLFTSYSSILSALFFLQMSIAATANFSKLQGITNLNLINVLVPFYMENVLNVLLALGYATDVLIIQMRLSAINRILSRVKPVSAVASILFLYSELLDSIDIVNNIYGTMIVFRTAHDFLASVGSCYIIVLILQSVNGAKLYATVVIFLFCFISWMKIIIQTFSSNLARNEVSLK